MLDTQKTTPITTNTPNTNANQPLSKTANGDVSQDSKNLVIINWLGCLFAGFIPPLVLMLIKKDDAYVQQQSKEALNWCITFFIGYIVLWIVAMILGFILGMIFGPLAALPMMIVGLIAFSHPVFCIMGAVKGSSGANFKIPFNLRLIK